MRQGIFTILISFILTGICLGKGHPLTYQVQYFSVNQGLPDHRIYSLLEHSNGFVYVWTYKGLSRFDGYGFSTPNIKGIHPWDMSSQVNGLLEFTDGSIGLMVSDKSRKHRVDIIHIEGEQYTWIPSGQMTGNTVTVQTDTGLVTFACLDPVNRIDHETVYDQHGNKVTDLNASGAPGRYLVLADNDTLDLTDIWHSMAESQGFFGRDFSQVIFIPTLNGLVKIDVTRSPFKLYLNKEIRQWEYQTQVRMISKLGADTLFVATEHQGLAMVNLITGKTTFLHFKYAPTGASLSLNEPRGMLIHDDGTIWIFPRASSACALNLKQGTAGIFPLENGFVTFRSAQISESEIVLSGIDRDQVNGLCLFNTNTHASQVVPLTVLPGYDTLSATYILPVSSNRLWYGTTKGLFLVDLQQKQIIKGYFGKGDADNEAQYAFPVTDCLSGSNILVLYADDDGRLWIGLEAGGINRLDPRSDQVEFYTTENGLPSNTVCGILPDKTGYWFSTYHGLSHFDTTSQTFRNFFKEDGLSHDEFNRLSAFRSVKGEYFFGTMNGVTSFRPEAVLQTPQQPLLLVSEIGYYQRGGKDAIVLHSGLHRDLSLQIPASNRNCYFSLSTTDFKNPDGNIYSYKLQPTDHPDLKIPWKQNGRNRTVQFEYLPSGNYLLYLKGVSSSGIATAPLTVHLHVREFFYRTWWFILACVVTLISLMYGLYRYRLLQILQMERLRLKLSSDLHDDVGGLLSGVAYQMELLEQTIGEKHKSLVQQVAASSRQAMSQMRDVIWAIDPRRGTFRDLVERMHEFADELLSPLDISYQFYTDDQHLNREINTEVRHHVLLIFKEFLSNTLKHANATEINVQLQYKGPVLHMILKDNGIGRDPAKAHSTGQGMDNMEMRAQRIGGTLVFNSQGGFSVHLRVPVP